MTISRTDIASTDFSDVDSGQTIPRTLPGDVLHHDFLEPLGLSAYALAKATDVPANRITGIINGERAITANTAILLARHLGTSPEFWMNLQSNYDLGIELDRLSVAA